MGPVGRTSVRHQAPEEIEQVHRAAAKRDAENAAKRTTTAARTLTPGEKHDWTHHFKRARDRPAAFRVTAPDPFTTPTPSPLPDEMADDNPSKGGSDVAGSLLPHGRSRLNLNLADVWASGDDKRCDDWRRAVSISCPCLPDNAALAKDTAPLGDRAAAGSLRAFPGVPLPHMSLPRQDSRGGMSNKLSHGGPDGVASHNPFACGLLNSNGGGGGGPVVSASDPLGLGPSPPSSHDYSSEGAFMPSPPPGGATASRHSSLQPQQPLKPLGAPGMRVSTSQLPPEEDDLMLLLAPMAPSQPQSMLSAPQLSIPGLDSEEGLRLEGRRAVEDFMQYSRPCMTFMESMHSHGMLDYQDCQCTAEDLAGLEALVNGGGHT